MDLPMAEVAAPEGETDEYRGKKRKKKILTFIKDEQFAATNDSSCQCKDLPLANR